MNAYASPFSKGGFRGIFQVSNPPPFLKGGCKQLYALLNNIYRRILHPFFIPIRWFHPDGCPSGQHPLPLGERTKVRGHWLSPFCLSSFPLTPASGVNHTVHTSGGIFNLSLRSSYECIRTCIRISPQGKGNYSPDIITLAEIRMNASHGNHYFHLQGSLLFFGAVLPINFICQSYETNKYETALTD